MQRIRVNNNYVISSIQASDIVVFGTARTFDSLKSKMESGESPGAEGRETQPPGPTEHQEKVRQQ